ncbi:MarR family transcriptional regulator [Guyparkeria halophila]|uniref:MarR family transcriptional regulator n=1 Tax=Guyparkeria halophila TaxID=47960 RepID=A0A6I6CXK7_9GAMM|nr:helix-turn-helix domain-containing protein [Guyparkeria halophila]QGT78919.1 MarR family transcriptional regulator [Guyparkeria halophila]
MSKDEMSFDTTPVQVTQTLSSLERTQYLSLVASIIEEFRKIDPEMHLNTIATYLMVAIREGRTKAEMADRLGVAQASTSRNVKVLTKAKNKFGKDGYDLVVQERDPREGRRHIVNLSQRGKMISNVLAEAALRANPARSAGG